MLAMRNFPDQTDLHNHIKQLTGQYQTLGCAM